MKTARRRFIQTVTWSSAAAIVPWQTPVAGSTEVWEIYNLSEDVHPMHFHLVNVQVINRQPSIPRHSTETPTSPVPLWPRRPARSAGRTRCECTRAR